MNYSPASSFLSWDCATTITKSTHESSSRLSSTWDVMLEVSFNLCASSSDVNIYTMTTLKRLKLSKSKSKVLIGGKLLGILSSRSFWTKNVRFLSLQQKRQNATDSKGATSLKGRKLLCNCVVTLLAILFKSNWNCICCINGPLR